MQDSGSSHAGFVLVGGASSRMGRDKARLPFEGRTLVEHVAAIVAQAAGSATLIGAPERYADLGFARLADTHPGWGPLGGIYTALGASQAAWNLIVACDMPGLEATFLKSLIAAAEASEADCLIPLSPSGRIEPLCGVYHSRCAAAIGKALESGVRKITAALGELRVDIRNFGEARWFSNINTPEEWIEQTNG